ncbi:hypothetical protein, partial [uncultured Victivallis sp.]|uniref:hypothetical protein n=1 Tax=uncultured Victivallis sp. TaxID=354118 RepID=UPI002589A924
EESHRPENRVKRALVRPRNRIIDRWIPPEKQLRSVFPISGGIRHNDSAPNIAFASHIFNVKKQINQTALYYQFFRLIFSEFHAII